MQLLIALAAVALSDPGAGFASPAGQEAVPNGATAATESDADKFNRAFNLIKNGKAAQAIVLLDKITAAFEARHGRDSQTYCARSQSETLYYLGLVAAQSKSAEVLDETLCDSYFFKGYALIDLGRPDDAKRMLDKAVAMAPMNSHYLGERAEWYKSRRDWPHAYAEFEAAAEASGFSPDDMKTFDKGRAWRGMAFVLIEEGKIDEAEAMLRKCLELDPDDKKAASELDYIKSRRPPAA